MPREILLHNLVGKIVRDVDGKKVGRIEELMVEIELHEHGNEYVGSEFHVGAYGLLEAFTGGAFARRFIQRLGPLAKYHAYRITCEQVDLADPQRPRIDRRREELDVENLSGASHRR
jgi:hypothetical protein